MTNTTMSLYEEIKGMSITNTHCHHLPDEQFKGADLRSLLSRSYCNWMSPPPAPGDRAAAEEYIRRYRCNTYFRWLFAALERLYGLPFTAENLPELDERVKKAHGDPQYHLRVLREDCRFERIINERQPEPGSDLGHPELFSPSFRCDCFFSGYQKDRPEPNGFYAWSLFEGQEPETLDEYLSLMAGAISAKKRAGCAALKVAIAYERPIDFHTPDSTRAARAFRNPDPAPGDIIAFGDTVMFALARAAAGNGMPLQIHTGMGQLERTNPIGLLRLIKANPDTRFHLLHGGFPWTADTLALLHNLKNVWSDTCWMPYLSAEAARGYIIAALEVSDAHRLTWGCDAWMSEDSLGARMAMEHTLARALAEMVDDGAFDSSHARYIAGRILRENGRELFCLG